MRIVVSGSTGLIGSALLPALRNGGHTLVPLVRGQSAPHKELETAIAWNPATGQLDARLLEGIDAVVHLAGENIAAARWTPAFKARLRESRVVATRLLAETLARLEKRPTVLVCASAVGIYGDRGEELLTEDSPPGKGFLAELCRDWEAAADAACAAGIRVVHLRFGVVLSPGGGALARILPVFRAGLGGRVGAGRQYWPWVTIDDVVGVIRFVLETPTLTGPVNVVAPELVTNKEFVRILGRVLGRPAIVPVPASILRLAVGEMATESLLASARVQPARLLATGYQFLHGRLEPAFRSILRH